VSLAGRISRGTAVSHMYGISYVVLLVLFSLISVALTLPDILGSYAPRLFVALRACSVVACRWIVLRMGSRFCAVRKQRASLRSLSVW